MGDIKLSNNFEVNVSVPIDSRYVVEDITERDALSFRYEGLKTYVKSEGKFYYWNGVIWTEENFSTLGVLTQTEVVGTTISGENVDTGITISINVIGTIDVIINGLITKIESDKNGPFYFSKDGGLTATNIYIGSKFYWNSSVAGYDLDNTDQIIFKGIS